MTEKQYLFRFSYMFENGTGTMDINLTGKNLNHECLKEVTIFIKNNLKNDLGDRAIKSLQIMSWSRIYQ